MRSTFLRGSCGHAQFYSGVTPGSVGPKTPETNCGGAAGTISRAQNQKQV